MTHMPATLIAEPAHGAVVLLGMRIGLLDLGRDVVVAVALQKKGLCAGGDVVGGKTVVVCGGVQGVGGGWRGERSIGRVRRVLAKRMLRGFEAVCRLQKRWHDLGGHGGASCEGCGGQGEGRESLRIEDRARSCGIAHARA